MMTMDRRSFLAAGAALGVATASWPTLGQTPASAVLTNVSYDPTRELYRAVNDAFASEWQRGGGQKLTVRLEHAVVRGEELHLNLPTMRLFSTR